MKAGFARIDITPPLGVLVAGYFETRLADGVIDPLTASAVVFDDGEKRAVLICADQIGYSQELQNRVRAMVAETIGTVREAVFICCTHTHLGPELTTEDYRYVNLEYIEQFAKKMCDVAVLAAQDLKPATFSYVRGKVEDVAFIRRFRMKDGSVRTNPGFQNPNIEAPLGTPDENSSLLIIKREDAPEIGIVNFQVHPDVIGGSRLSADYPKFVRETYEKLIDNSRCIYINGAQGDTNHVDCRLGKDQCRHGYDRAKYMGSKIAMSVAANYIMAQPLRADKISYGQKSTFVDHNKGTAEELENALKINAVYLEKGAEAAVPYAEGMRRIEIVAEAERIVHLKDSPEEKELYLTAIAVGDVVFAGFPGEPFTDIGRAVKEQSKFTLTMPACCANGYEGYFPMQRAFDEGGYEALTARYKAGVAEKVIETSVSLINSL